jgi:hypothetical protein
MDLNELPLPCISFSTATDHSDDLMFPTIPVTRLDVTVNGPISVLMSSSADMLAPTFLNSLAYGSVTLAGQTHIYIVPMPYSIDNIVRVSTGSALCFHHTIIIANDPQSVNHEKDPTLESSIDPDLTH